MKNIASTKQQAASRDSNPASCLLPPARYSGFTLVETLVAIAILMLSVAGPLFTANRAIVAAQNASAQVTATYLAQEGIEQVRAMRDNAYLYEYLIDSTMASTTGWYDFADRDSTLTTGHIGITQWCQITFCYLDPTKSMGYSDYVGPNSGPSLTSCGSANPGPDYCKVFLYLTSTGQYTTDSLLGGTKTAFFRRINVVPNVINPPNLASMDVVVVSSVRWISHAATYEVVATEHLSPWQ